MSSNGSSKPGCVTAPNFANDASSVPIFSTVEPGRGCSSTSSASEPSACWIGDETAIEAPFRLRDFGAALALDRERVAVFARELLERRDEVGGDPLRDERVQRAGGARSPR